MNRSIISMEDTGRRWTDPTGYSGFDPNAIDKVLRNPDGSIQLGYITYNIYDSTLSCGHKLELKSTGFWPPHVSCDQCD